MFIIIEVAGNLLQDKKVIISLDSIKTIEENRNKDSDNNSVINLKGGEQFFCKKTIDNIKDVLYNKNMMIK